MLFAYHEESIRQNIYFFLKNVFVIFYDTMWCHSLGEGILLTFVLSTKLKLKIHPPFHRGTSAAMYIFDKYMLFWRFKAILCCSFHDWVLYYNCIIRLFTRPSVVQQMCLSILSQILLNRLTLYFLQQLESEEFEVLTRFNIFITCYIVIFTCLW